MVYQHIIAMVVIWGLSSWGWALELSSRDIQQGVMLKSAQVFNGFGCEGKNYSPELHWRDAPKGTQSFAVTAYDPDAPTGSGWWHWVVFNIPKTIQSLPGNAGQVDGHLLPKKTIQGRNDFGIAGFGGACPPEGHGVHRYQFTVFALDVAELPLGKDATAAMVGYMIRSHALGSAQIESLFERK